MIHILLFLAMGVGLQSSVPTSTGIQQTDTHGPCVGDGCGHPYYYMHLHGAKPKHPKHAEKDELPDPTKLDMCMMDHGPYGCEEFGGPTRWAGYGYSYCPNKEHNGIVLCSSPDAGKIAPGGDPGLTVPPCAATREDSFFPCSLPSGPNVAIGSCESGICTLGIPDNVSSSIESNDGSKVVSLSDKEYNHLQEIRQAVGDEEKRLAAKYGANLDDYAFQTFPSLSTYPEAIHHADHFEFHGRFLIIDKSK